MRIRVTGSKWVSGSGWSYTECLDPMEVNSIDEVEAAAKSYAAEFAGNYGKLLGKNEDYQLRFYADENSLVTIWMSDAIAQVK